MLSARTSALVLRSVCASTRQDLEQLQGPENQETCSRRFASSSWLESLGPSWPYPTGDVAKRENSSREEDPGQLPSETCLQGPPQQSHAQIQTRELLMALFATSSFVFSSDRLLKEEDGEVDFKPSFERGLEDSKTKT